MRSSSRRVFYNLSLLVGLCLALNKPAFADDSASPWLRPDTGDQYLFVGKAVWDVDAGRMVSPTGGPNFLYQTHRILGVNDRVFGTGTGPKPPGMSPVGYIAMLDGSGSKPVTLDGKQEDTGMGPGFWVAADHRRVLWIQAGDYWRGEIDWAKSQIVNRKQVTSLGAFNNLNTPLLWWDQFLFVWGGFDKEKPFVRINLATGVADELDVYDRTLNIESRTFFSVASPNHCRVAIGTSAIIYSYDARTNKPTLIRNKLEDITTANGIDPLQGEVPLIWADDDTAYFVNSRGFLIKIDFRNARMDVICQPKVLVYGDPPATTRIQSILPGGHFADEVTTGPGGQSGDTGFRERFLFDTTTGQRIILPFDDKAYGVWLDDSRYLYTREKGSLSTVGIWLYDRVANSNKRLAGGTIDYQRMMLMKKQNQVWAVSQQSGSNLRRINLDGSGTEDYGPCELSIPVRMPVDEPIDLGFTNMPVDLWKPTPIDGASLAATQPAETPAGKLVLLQLIKDLPVEERKFADNAYDYSATNAPLKQYYNPTKVAMKALEHYRADPKSPLNNFVSQLDLTDAFDRDHIARYGHDHSFELIAMDMKLTVDQKKEIANRVGPALADAVLKDLKVPVRNIDLLFQNCLADARKEVTGSAGPTGPAPAAPPQQQAGAPPQSPATSAKPSPPPANQQSKIDKAAEKTRKAKDVTNKLKGLFGQ